MNVILIAGLWLDGTAWEHVLPGLSARGHQPVPLTLPGQGDGAQAATLADQQATVVAAVDEADEPVCVVGHSAACGLAWLAADARPDKVATVALVGGMPVTDGDAYADFFEVTDGEVPFPGWEPFAGPDSDDLSEPTKAEVAAGAIPVPEGVVKGVVTYAADRRYAVPVVMVCPEFTPDQARGWLAAGDIPELAKVERVDYVDLDSGHWPMFSQPEALAGVLADIAEAE
ncbi:MAG: alpha/beta hydrolase [Ornithinimicrobium sp.]